MLISPLSIMHAGDCFLPVRVGQLTSPGSDYSVSGLVYLLDRSSIYIKDFNSKSRKKDYMQVTL